ncbi:MULTISPECIES: MMPL family transporter [unclassified Luteococcus]|uniref:MMPL family transporter n=1 Tax=unclassified Luteococcus TaxID=2639923 RepID=UPI00313B0429
MSSFLYRLGRACYRHGRRVLALWLAVLIALGGLTATLGGKYSDNFSIPGAPSQMALDKLHLTFPEAAAMSANALVILPEGTPSKDTAARSGVERVVKGLATDPMVSRATSPYDPMTSGLLSDDGRAAMIQLQLDKTMATITDGDRARLVDVANRLEAELPPGSEITMGGQAYAIEVPTMTATEGLGLIVALVVLFVTLGSMIAAGLPLLTAVVGVALSMCLIMLAAGLADVNSTTPMLAVMLGLAVGIDYALFILSRHREQLRGTPGHPGLDPEESTAQAVATAGSAVVFAGLTVCIALIGLALANIPFLTVMGAFAAVAVALAVVIALTALPALMGLLGERMRPRATARAKAAQAVVEDSDGQPARPAAPRRRSPYDWWVGVVTRFPVVTLLVVVVGLTALSVPAASLRMSLPNAGQQTAGTPARVEYDLVAKHFGPGFNGPLIVTADILASDDPMGIMNRLKADIEATEGVQQVLIATPNRNADTGFVQVVPTTAPDDPATGTLVQRLVDKHDEWLTTPGTETAVTGQTAIQIDISQRLANALIPFGIFVVGLSFVLLMMVFRSFWVPVKATVGYLLSVGAAFGATQLVFNRGIGAQVINLEKPTPIISFMPIVIMGILFGLAMDYEVFLVSRMREDYVHARRRNPDADRTELARQAILSGFKGSAPVVTAAAVIMFAVFAFFVPEGMGPIKQIAFGLALGVAADAFLVRMTLVPAVLQLLGDRAWWLPGWLDRLLPVLDVEGEGLHRELELDSWPTPVHTEALHADSLSADGLFGATSLHLEPGQVAVVQGDSYPRRALLLALSGRLAVTDGKARVGGQLLPGRAADVRRVTAQLEATSASGLAHDLAAALRRNPRVVLVDGADSLAGPDLAALERAVEDARRAAEQVVAANGDIAGAPAFVLGVHDRGAIARWRPERTINLVAREAVARTTRSSSSPVPSTSDSTPQDSTPPGATSPSSPVPAPGGSAAHQLTESL